MHERIKQLLEKARVQDYWSVEQARYMVDYIDHEKFSTLLIEECAEIADANWRNQCPGFYIKEYFGVKE